MTTSFGEKKATLPAEVRARLLWWAAQGGDLEVCGVVVNGEALLLENVHPEPENFFRMKDEELLAAYDKGVPSAVWHSHPNGDPAPSTADVDGTPPGMTMLIVAGGEIYSYDLA